MVEVKGSVSQGWQLNSSSLAATQMKAFHNQPGAVGTFRQLRRGPPVWASTTTNYGPRCQAQLVV